MNNQQNTDTIKVNVIKKETNDSINNDNINKLMLDISNPDLSKDIQVSNLESSKDNFKEIDLDSYSFDNIEQKMENKDNEINVKKIDIQDGGSIEDELEISDLKDINLDTLVENNIQKKDEVDKFNFQNNKINIENLNDNFESVDFNELRNNIENKKNINEDSDIKIVKLNNDSVDTNDNTNDNTNNDFNFVVDNEDTVDYTEQLRILEKMVDNETDLYKDYEYDSFDGLQSGGSLEYNNILPLEFDLVDGKYLKTIEYLENKKSYQMEEYYKYLSSFYKEQKLKKNRSNFDYIVDIEGNYIKRNKNKNSKKGNYKIVKPKYEKISDILKYINNKMDNILFEIKFSRDKLLLDVSDEKFKKFEELKSDYDKLNEQKNIFVQYDKTINNSDVKKESIEKLKLMKYSLKEKIRNLSNEMKNEDVINNNNLLNKKIKEYLELTYTNGTNILDDINNKIKKEQKYIYDDLIILQKPIVIFEPKEKSKKLTLKSTKKKDKKTTSKKKIQKSKAEEPELDRTVLDEPKNDEPEVKGIKAEKLEEDEPEVDEPEVDEPEVDEPEVDEPEVDEPIKDEPKLKGIIGEEPEEELKVEKLKLDEPEEELKVEKLKLDEPKVETKSKELMSGGQVDFEELNLDLDDNIEEWANTGIESSYDKDFNNFEEIDVDLNNEEINLNNQDKFDNQIDLDLEIKDTL